MVKKSDNFNLEGDQDDIYSTVSEVDDRFLDKLSSKVFGISIENAAFYNKWILENQKQIILNPIIEGKYQNTCDLGCGDGFWHQYLFQNGYGGIITGFDISNSALAIAKTINNNFRAQYVQSDVYSVDCPDDYFDCLFSLQLWQSIKYPNKFIKQINRISKTGAPAFITTTNFTSNLLFQPTVFIKQLFYRTQPNNSEDGINKILKKNKIKYKIEYISFRPRQSYMKYIPSFLFEFIFNKCKDIEEILRYLGFSRLCSVIIIAINNDNNIVNEKKKPGFSKYFSSAFIFTVLVIFHWLIDIMNFLTRKFKIS